jgi:hypothetical protein
MVNGWPMVCVSVWFVVALSLMQQAQNPSPMVEHTRAHPRLTSAAPSGQRDALEVGTLFVPDRLRLKSRTPLFIHFHGGPLVPEIAAATIGGTAVISVDLGSGSSAYAKPFLDPARFGRLIAEAEATAHTTFAPITLTSWSAGYGAVREILRVPQNYARVDRVVLIDGMHAGYVDGTPDPNDLDTFLTFARDAVAGRKAMLITHSEIFPGTYASTTETADWLLGQLGLTRTAVLQWGPTKTQQLSDTKRGRFHLVGFAGNAAPDHVDQLHSLPEYLKWVK